MRPAPASRRDSPQNGRLCCKIAAFRRLRRVSTWRFAPKLAAKTSRLFLQRRAGFFGMPPRASSACAIARVPLRVSKGSRSPNHKYNPVIEEKQTGRATRRGAPNQSRPRLGRERLPVFLEPRRRGCRSKEMVRARRSPAKSECWSEFRSQDFINSCGSRSEGERVKAEWGANPSA